MPNNTAQTVNFPITATTLTNAPPGYTFPAVAVTGMSAGRWRIHPAMGGRARRPI